MTGQNAFGSRKVHRMPVFDGVTKIARVTSTKDYASFGRIEVVFLDYGQPMPVWVVGDIDREPVVGDHVIISYIDGRKDAPYMVGFVKNRSQTTNFFKLRKDEILLQLPVHDRDQDIGDYLLDEDKKDKRAYVELTPEQITVHFPTQADGSESAVIRITAEGVEISHPGEVKITGETLTFGSGGRPVARLGDTVQVDLMTGEGTITSASDKVSIE